MFFYHVLNTSTHYHKQFKKWLKYINPVSQPKMCLAYIMDSYIYIFFCPFFLICLCPSHVTLKTLIYLFPSKKNQYFRTISALKLILMAFGKKYLFHFQYICTLTVYELLLLQRLFRSRQNNVTVQHFLLSQQSCWITERLSVFTLTVNSEWYLQHYS